MEGLTTASLEFEYAYAQNSDFTDFTDSLLVYISVDCGDTWTRIFSGGEDGSGNFATHEPTSYTFFPEIESDWCMDGWGAPCVSLNLSSWVGNSGVQIAFESYGSYVNPITIDNVEIMQFVGTNENITGNSNVRIYPNPTSGAFTIIIPNDVVYKEIVITNQLGQDVYSHSISDNDNRVLINEASKWRSGVYFVKLIGDSNTDTKKIIIK